MAKKSWKEIGSPKSSKYAMQSPTIVTVPCMLRSMPRFPGLHISDWYIEMVEELNPFPTPVTIRPTSSWASVVHDPSRIVFAPVTIMFFRPKCSPKKKVKR
jgi:hypothetical protein